MPNIKPILFSTPLVQAIMEGRKTQTRRVIKPQPVWEERPATGLLMSGWAWRHKDGGGWNAFPSSEAFAASIKEYAPCQPGTILWVRETWCLYESGGLEGYVYKASGDSPDGAACWQDGKWRPSIFMPKEAARLFLRVTDVRAERLQEITEEDAIAEGCARGMTPDGGTTPALTARQAYMWLWESLNAKRGFCWGSNPWVWVYTFERCDRPEGFPS